GQPHRRGKRRKRSRKRAGRTTPGGGGGEEHAPPNTRRFASCVSGWSTSNTSTARRRNRRYARESKPAPRITSCSKSLGAAPRITSSINLVRATTEGRTPGHRRSMNHETNFAPPGMAARRITSVNGQVRKCRASGSSQTRPVAGRNDSSARKSAFCSAVRLARPSRIGTEARRRRDGTTVVDEPEAHEALFSAFRQRGVEQAPPDPWALS